MEQKVFEFKASSAEQAIKNGLAELGLTENDVTVEVLSNGGIFSKAVVRLTVIDKPEEEQVAQEEPAAVAEESAKEVVKSEPVVKGAERSGANPTQENLVQAKGYLEEVLRLMNIKARVDAKIKGDELCLCVTGDDAKAVIGHRGEVLDSLQCLVSQVINGDKYNDERVRVTIDADFYRERRKKILSALAKKVARQALDARHDIALEPMNSYERRIIHSALQDSPDATTFSEGEGKDRHVVISPKCEKISYGTSQEFKKKGLGKTKSYGYKKRF